jgi:hypothetical protein
VRRREIVVGLIGLLAFIATWPVLFPEGMDGPDRGYSSSIVMAYAFVAAVMATATFAFYYTPMAWRRRALLVVPMLVGDALLWAGLVAIAPLGP